VNRTSGEFIWFDGKVTTHDALKKVGAIIERPNFYPYMSAYQNLKLVCKIKNVEYSKIDEKLEIVGLTERKDSKFSTYSLGMKQRLAIASALLNDPEILILDEPTNGLDPQGIHQIRSLIKQIASQGTTILLASHLLDEVEKVCSHVVVLRKGEKLYSGRVDEMISSHGFFELKTKKHEELIKLLEADENFGKLKVEDELITAFLNEPMDASTFNKLMFDKGITLSHLVKRKESLEEQFLQLTDNK
jgi:ABC-2 type transport system ATP-binding protein